MKKGGVYKTTSGFKRELYMFHCFGAVVPCCRRRRSSCYIEQHFSEGTQDKTINVKQSFSLSFNEMHTLTTQATRMDQR